MASVKAASVTKWTSEVMLQIEKKHLNSPKTLHLKYLLLIIFLWLNYCAGCEWNQSYICIFITNHGNTDTSETYWDSVNHMNQWNISTPSFQTSERWHPLAVVDSKWVWTLAQSSFYTTSVKTCVGETKFLRRSGICESQAGEKLQGTTLRTPQITFLYTWRKSMTAPLKPSIKSCLSLTSLVIQSSSSCPSCWSCPGSLSWSPGPPVDPCAPGGTQRL